MCELESTGTLTTWTSQNFSTTTRADSRLVPSQWEMSLRSNVISHWMGAILADSRLASSQWETSVKRNTISHWLGAILADSRLAPSQWKTLVQSNGVSHWLGAILESTLTYVHTQVINTDTDNGLYNYIPMYIIFCMNYVNTISADNLAPHITRTWNKLNSQELNIDGLIQKRCSPIAIKSDGVTSLLH